MPDRTLIILTPGFPGSEAETSCLPAQQLFIKALHRADPKLNIIIIAFQYPFTKNVYQWNGITVIPFNGRNRGHVFRRILWVKAIRLLKALRRQNNVIGILSFWLGECAYVSHLFASRYDIPQFYWLLGQDAKKDNAFIKKIEPNPQSLIAISDFIANEFYKNYSIMPDHVIPVGIDPNMFDDVAASRDIDILGAGSLIPLKQYDVFIRVIADLKKDFPGIRTQICGEGPERKLLTAAIKVGGLASNIELRGELPNQQVIGLMQSTRIFLHPSLYEGFSGVCAEALYAGAHVVSFCKPINKDFEHWHVVKDYGEMVLKVRELLSVALEHERVLTYSVDEAADKILKLIEALRP